MIATQNNIDLFAISEIELVYRSKIKPSERPKVSDASSAAALFLHNWNDDKIGLCEEFKVMLLNPAGRVLGMVSLSLGGLTGTVADPRFIFAAALKCAASGIILAHNHPSGNLNPSKADIQLTDKVKEGGKILEITLMDHLIVTPEKTWFSFADQGLI